MIGGDYDVHDFKDVEVAVGGWHNATNCTNISNATNDTFLRVLEKKYTILADGYRHPPQTTLFWHN